mgnify:CR=1 FL=1
MKCFVPDSQRNLFADFFTRRIDTEVLVRGLGGDPVGLSADWLHRGMIVMDAEAIELALFLGFRFGFAPGVGPDLVSLACADWHTRHEDVVDAIADLKVEEGIDALVQLTSFDLAYRDFDDSDALATKCLWALAKIGTGRALQKLIEFRGSSHPGRSVLAAELIRWLAQNASSSEVKRAAALEVR